MKFQILWKDDILADVNLPENKKDTSIILHQTAQSPVIFPNGPLNQERIYQFVKSRCFEEGRVDLPEILKEMGLTEYNPWKMIQVTHGVDWDDFYWIRFEGEDLSWKDVKVRD